MGRDNVETRSTDLPLWATLGIAAGGLLVLIGAVVMATRDTTPTSSPGVSAAPAPATSDADSLGQTSAAGIIAGLSAMEYEVSWQELSLIEDAPAGYQAPNRAQNLRTYFYQDGPKVIQRTDSDPDWVWEYHLTSFGRPDRLEAVETATIKADRSRVEYDRGSLTEWYVNSPDGLEQGFTIHDRPAGNGPVMLQGAVPDEFAVRESAAGTGLSFLTQSQIPVLAYGHLVVEDATGNRLDARFEIDGDALSIVFDDSQAEYPVIVDPLLTSPTWEAASGQNGSRLGASVSSAGDVNQDGFDDIIVGAPFYDDGEANEGKVFV